MRNVTKKKQVNESGLILEGFFNKNKPQSNTLTAAQLGMKDSKVKFLGAPIFVENNGIDEFLQEVKQDAEESFNNWMSTNGKQFFTKSNYGVNIRNTRDFNIKYAVIDENDTGFIYTVIGNFKQDNLPFSIKINVNLRGDIYFYIQPGNIRVNR